MDLELPKQNHLQEMQQENSENEQTIENIKQVDLLVEQEATVENQNHFLQTTLGKVINSAIDIGLKSVLPDVIENQIVDIKNALLTNGLKNGIQTTIDSAIQLGKSILGITTGKFDNLSQVYNAVKKGGIIESFSELMDNVVGTAQKKNRISVSTGRAIKRGKNAILNTISSNLEEMFFSQVNSIEKVSKYIKNWKDYYEQKDFQGMEKEYQKIKQQLSTVMPLEETISEAKKIENMHNLLKSKGPQYELSEEEKQLVNVLK